MRQLWFAAKWSPTHDCFVAMIPCPVESCPSDAAAMFPVLDGKILLAVVFRCCVCSLVTAR